MTDKSTNGKLVTIDDELPQVHPVGLQTPEQLGASVDRYEAFKKVLDTKLGKDGIIHVNGKPFRKKNYWRGIGHGFQLNLEIIKDERVELDEDWGYTITVRATDPNTGRYVDGDGACFASEKAQARANIGATVHNVRGHAKTRATNRAISDMVAFGEVSAEEVQRTYQSSDDEIQQAPKVIAPKVLVEKKATLEDHDGVEKVEEVVAKRTLDNGTVVYKIVTTKRTYSCLNEDVRQLAEQAHADNVEIEPDWEEKSFKNGKSYNALRSVELVYPIS